MLHSGRAEVKCKILKTKDRKQVTERTTFTATDLGRCASGAFPVSVPAFRGLVLPHWRRDRHRSNGLGPWWPGLIRALMVLPIALAFATAFADVRETPHNLIKSRDKNVDEKQVCVFCHTPALDVSPGGIGGLAGGSAAPAWQKSISNSFVFTIYDDIGRLGLGKPSIGSQSIACLSCHDANQADGSARISMDHPFGVPYRGATKGLLSGTLAAAKRDSTLPFREAQHLLFLEDFRDVSQGVVENRQVFWVSRQGTTARRTRADLPLYGRVITGLPAGSELSELEGVSVPHIECSSCHDPHAKTATFLRVPPEESKLCLTCHDK